jgi:pyridoxine kinase
MMNSWALQLMIAKRKIGYSFAGWIEGYYHGTGDVFGSALVAALLKGCDLADATAEAVKFTVGSIARTKGSWHRYPVWRRF